MTRDLGSGPDATEMAWLAGKACAITGTGGSMGRAAALTFVREGASVVGCDVSVGPAEETVTMVHAAGSEMVSLQPCHLGDPEHGIRVNSISPGLIESNATREELADVPAAAGTLAAFSANGLFAGLSGLFLAITFHHPSHALSGAALFLVFTAGVASQLATGGLPASRVLALGTVSMLTGPVLGVAVTGWAQPGHRGSQVHP